MTRPLERPLHQESFKVAQKPQLCVQLALNNNELLGILILSMGHVLSILSTHCCFNEIRVGHSSLFHVLLSLYCKFHFLFSLCCANQTPIKIYIQGTNISTNKTVSFQGPLSHESVHHFNSFEVKLVEPSNLKYQYIMYYVLNVRLYVLQLVLLLL